MLLAGDTVLAGCVQLKDGGQVEQLELMRDLAWDPRLDQALPVVLRRIQQARACPSLVTALDDAPMAELLESQGWIRGDEQLLLGRSLWRRQTTPRNVQLSRSLDQVFGRLRPQGQALPSPSLGRR